MRILVAGSTGVVGRILVPKLVEAGHETIGVTRDRGKMPMIRGSGARPVVADVLNEQEIKSVFEETRPEVVIHQLTALKSRDFQANTRVRVEGTRNLVLAAKAVGVRRMIAESIAWAYEPGEGLAKETTPLDTGAKDSRARLVEGIRSLEGYVSQMPEYVLLRYGVFYGKDTFYDHGGFVAKEVSQGNVPATTGITSFIHVHDAATAALLALDWPCGPVNIVDDDPAKGTDWLPVFATLLGAPMPEMRPDCLASERGASNDKARTEYGWKPIYPTWRTGFAASLSQNETTSL